jgi:hypothetical protein
VGVKDALIQQHHGQFKVSRACEVLRLSRSGYYEWCERPESARGREGQYPKLLGAGHAAHPSIACVAIDYAEKTRSRDKVHNLCEQCLADIHMQSPTEANGENYTNLTHRVSNRHQMKSAAKSRWHWVLACA